MIKLVRMIDCSFSEALEAWNEGFKGYHVDMTMNVSAFMQRMNKEDLSPEYSWIAFSNHKPIGLILNGIREINGKKIAWNGGTGVAPEFRGTGVGRMLVEKALDTYHENQVEECYLEAIIENTKAIALYEKLNYKVINNLFFLKNTSTIPANIFKSINSIILKETYPQEAEQLNFYEYKNPWQTQWQSIKTGRSLIAYKNNDPIGYSLYQEQFNTSYAQNQTLLYQCNSFPNHPNEKEILKAMLYYIFRPLHQVINRTAINIPKTNHSLIQILEESGFEKTVEQVQMKQML